MEIKENLVKILDSKKLTIKELSEQIGMSETGLHYTLKNNTIKFETVLKICNFLNISLDLLINFNENNINNNQTNVLNLTKISSSDWQKSELIDEIKTKIRKKIEFNKISKLYLLTHDYFNFLNLKVLAFISYYDILINKKIIELIDENKSISEITDEIKLFEHCIKENHPKNYSLIKSLEKSVLNVVENFDFENKDNVFYTNMIEKHKADLKKKYNN